jgi:hypothetical protein
VPINKYDSLYSNNSSFRLMIGAAQAQVGNNDAQPPLSVGAIRDPNLRPGSHLRVRAGTSSFPSRASPVPKMPASAHTPILASSCQTDRRSRMRRSAVPLLGRLSPAFSSKRQPPPRLHLWLGLCDARVRS